MKLLQILKRRIEDLEAFFNKLRARIPGLPGNRVIFSVVILVIAAVVLFATFQLLLAPKEKFSTYTLPYEQNFDDVNLRRWFLGDGVWTIRDAALNQTVGGDTPAQVHIPFKLPEDAPYHASLYITLKKDSREAGISFNSQYPDLTGKQHRVYLSRSDKNTLELVAGYMDETGSFINQVKVPLPVNTTEFRLDLYVYQNTYLVQVNGQRLIEDRPLFYKNGLIGFYSLGPAIFDTFKLTSADNPNPGNLIYTSDFDQTPGGAGWVPFSGKWKIADKQMQQTDAVFMNAGIGYETSSFQNFTLRATFQHIKGHGAGVLFNMPSPYQLNGAQVVRYSDETDSIIWGSYDAQGAFNRQGFMNIDTPGTEVHTVQIFSGDSSYDVFLDDKILARDVPLVSKQGNVGLVTSGASAGYSLVEVFPLFGASGTETAQLTPVSTKGISSVQGTSAPEVSSQPESTSAKATSSTVAATKITGTKPTATKESSAKPTENAAAPTSNATPPSGTASITPPAPGNSVIGSQAPYKGDFTGKLADQGWLAINGKWSFKDGTFVQSQTNGYDLTAIYTRTAYKNFSFQVGFAHQQGSGAGLLFNLPNNDGLAGGCMVRYSDKRDNALIWGNFDMNGVYKNQGYAEVPHAVTDHHTLRVMVGNLSYSIYLDDRLIVQSVPFLSSHNNGYIGLLTSVASVVYDEVSIDGVGAAFKGNYTSLDGFTDQRIVSGKWTLGNNIITQTVPDPSDYVWNTGVQASKYTLSAKINLPAGSATSGGGFLLNMAERGSKNNSYIVRFTKGGKGIWWGSNDNAGKFKGQGSATVAVAGPTYTLKVIVDTAKMQVFVNDKQIAKDVPMTGVEGFVGLVAYGGPVSFQDVTLVVEE